MAKAPFPGGAWSTDLRRERKEVRAAPLITYSVRHQGGGGALIQHLEQTRPREVSKRHCDQDGPSLLRIGPYVAQEEINAVEEGDRLLDPQLRSAPVHEREDDRS
jgi:hypothetical protein